MAAALQTQKQALNYFTSFLNVFNAVLHNDGDLRAMHLHQCGQLNTVYCVCVGGGNTGVWYSGWSISK